MTNASTLILPPPWKQHTDSPNNILHQHSKRISSTVETGQYALSWAEDAPRVTDSGTTCSYTYPKAAERLPAASEGLHHTSPHPSSIIILSHSLALIRLLGGTWMQGMLQHCQGHYEAGLGLGCPPGSTHRHPHSRVGAAGKRQWSPQTPGLGCPSYEERHQDLWRSLLSQHSHSQDPKLLVLISCCDVMDDN